MYYAVGAGFVAVAAVAAAVSRQRAPTSNPNPDSVHANDAAIAASMQGEEDAALAASMQGEEDAALAASMQEVNIGESAAAAANSSSKRRASALVSRASAAAATAPASRAVQSYIPNSPRPPPQGAQPARNSGRDLSRHVVVLKRGTPSRPHYVPLCQFDAQTRQLGVGCWELECVPQAVAALWQRHAADFGVDRAWRELSAGYSTPAGNATSPFTQGRGFRFPKVHEDGDCFYHSVQLALGTIGVEVTIDELRACVASKLTDMHLELARVEPVPDLEGHLDSLDQYRARISRRGGAWADDFAAATVRDHLGLTAILLIDIEASTREGKYERLRI